LTQDIGSSFGPEVVFFPSLKSFSPLSFLFLLFSSSLCVLSKSARTSLSSFPQAKPNTNAVSLEARSCSLSFFFPATNLFLSPFFSKGFTFARLPPPLRMRQPVFPAVQSAQPFPPFVARSPSPLSLPTSQTGLLVLPRIRFTIANGPLLRQRHKLFFFPFRANYNGSSSGRGFSDVPCFFSPRRGS